MCPVMAHTVSSEKENIYTRKGERKKEERKEEEEEGGGGIVFQGSSCGAYKTIIEIHE